MKKLLASFIGLVIILTPVSIFAEQEASFIEAVGNIAKLEDTKILQSFYGRGEIEDVDYGEHVSFAYRFTINSAIDNDDTPGSLNRINVFVKAYNHNTPDEFNLPFKEISLNADLEFIIKNETDFYAKLSSFSINIEQPQGSAQQDVKELSEEIRAYIGTWYYEQAADLASEVESDIEVQQYLEFEDNLAEDPKMAITNLVQQALGDSDKDFAEGDIAHIVEGVSLILETKLFNHLDIVTGNNAGFKFFTLNKPAIIKLAKDFGESIEEPLRPEDEAEIRDFLSKFSFSGIYRIADDLLDNLVVRFKLKEVEILKNLEFNYRFKVMDTVSQNVITAPESYEVFDRF